jgi:AcrR family transcriptional regulator
LRVNLQARALNAELRRKRTRERLIAAALEVIAEKGAEAASIEDFVAAAGVSRGTFYNYFPAVEDLLSALNAQMGAEMDQTFVAVTEGVRDPALGLALVIQESFRQSAINPTRAWVALRIDGANVPRQAESVARFDMIFRAAVARGRFRSIDGDAARNLLFGAVRMAQVEILAGRADPAHTVELVALVLVAYGLALEEAAEISRQAADRVRALDHGAPVE